MATTRRPKGSYVRHTTDWFIDRCAIGGLFYFPAHGEAGVLELFNNATDGSYLHIYRIWYENEANGQYYFTRQTGTQGGTPIPSYSVVSNLGAPWGLLNYTTIPGLAFPYPLPFVFPAYIAGANDAGSQDTFATDGPLCVLVPGDSLRLITPIASSGISSGEICATMYWAVMPEAG